MTVNSCLCFPSGRREQSLISARNDHSVPGVTWRDDWSPRTWALCPRGPDPSWGCARFVQLGVQHLCADILLSQLLRSQREGVIIIVIIKGRMAKNAGWPITQTLSSCDSSRGRARSDCRSDEVHESSLSHLTPQCWQVSEDAIAKYSTVRLSHWDEHVKLLAGVTQQQCFQLIHGACCPGPGRCGIWFASPPHIYAAIF